MGITGCTDGNFDMIDLNYIHDGTISIEYDIDKYGVFDNKLYKTCKYDDSYMFNMAKIRYYIKIKKISLLRLLKIEKLTNSQSKQIDIIIQMLRDTEDEYFYNLVYKETGIELF